VSLLETFSLNAATAAPDFCESHRQRLGLSRVVSSCHIFVARALTRMKMGYVYKKWCTYQSRVDAADDRDAQVGRRPGNLDVTDFTL
jgi:hypothetical protein